MVTRKGSRSVSAEQRLKELGIKLPVPPEPFGIYAEAVRTGNLLFLTGMLPTEGREAKIVGRVGAELDVETGRKAARLAALNVLAVARQHLGSLDKVTRVVSHIWRCPRSAEGRRRRFGANARCFWKREEPLPPRVWRCKSSARHAGRAGSDL
jgi:YjgF/chorismate_mutase-like, putative endoribonuclease